MTTSMFASIKDALAKPAQGSSTTSNIMRLKTGNTYVLRLVPFVKDPSKTFFHYYSHGWVSEATGQFQSAISPQTWGERDPIAEARYKISRTGTEEEKEKAKALNRKENWLINVYVAKDPENPENEGKVFLFRYGKKIFDKLMAAMQPEFEDETPINPFDFWEGANFKLKIRKVDGYWNYDKSEFDNPSALFDNDGKIEEVWKSAYPLAEFSASTNFKSYEELKTRLDAVLSGSVTVGNVAEQIEDEPVATPKIDTTPVQSSSEEEDDDTMDYFQKLATG